jgi:glutathione S-transferase
LLAKLGIGFRHVGMHAFDGSTNSPEFLAKNPNGKVPLLELEDGRLLAESNAILLYLAEGTRFLPEDRYERALVYQWMFFEQYSHEPQIAVRRSLIKHKERAAQATPERLAALLGGGNRALGVMEIALRDKAFIAGDSISVADIALYAYTHDADAAGFDLSAYPNISDWLDRVSADPGHVPLEWVP